MESISALFPLHALSMAVKEINCNNIYFDIADTSGSSTNLGLIQLYIHLWIVQKLGSIFAVVF